MNALFLVLQEQQAKVKDTERLWRALALDRPTDRLIVVTAETNPSIVEEGKVSAAMKLGKTLCNSVIKCDDSLIQLVTKKELRSVVWLGYILRWHN